MMASWPRHIDRFKRQYDKAFARDPLFGEDLMDRIHKRVQVFLHSSNTTAIEEVKSGALEEFRGLQKKLERGEWVTSMTVWVERPAPREEGRRKSEGNGHGVRNHRVDLQLHISEILGILTQVARSENLCLPMGADGREICLRYISEVKCDRSCTRSHAPLQEHSRELVIRFIQGSQETINKNRNFEGVGAQASHEGTWDRGRYQNSDTHNGIRFCVGRGGCGGGRDGQNGRGGGGHGGNCSTTNPPTKTDRKLGAAVRTDRKEVVMRRQDDGLMGMRNSVRPAVRCPQEKLGPAIGIQ